MYKAKQIPFCLFLFLLFVNCSRTQGTTPEENDLDPNIIIDRENITVEKKFDVESSTYYYLTRIKHEDKDGKLLKLQHAHAIIKNGETVLGFAKRMNNPMLAINASMGIGGLPEGTKQTAGIQIVDGDIIQDLTSRNYTLGIKDNNKLLAYPPEMTAQDILDDGTKNALTGFVPLILNHEPVGEDVLNIVGNNVVKHPRQVIAQMDNLDLLILSCGGRGYDGQGMTAMDLIRVLQENDVKFGFNLDGGGSVTTVIEGELITKKIDGHGTELRSRSNFLYIE